MPLRARLRCLTAALTVAHAGCNDRPAGTDSGGAEPDDSSSATTETGKDAFDSGDAYCDDADFAVLEDFTPSEWDELWHPFGCHWAWVGGGGEDGRTGGSVTLALSFDLPPADLYVQAGSVYELEIGSEATFAFGEAGSGSDVLIEGDCIDTEAEFVGDVYVADAGRVELVTTYACSEPPNECTGDQPNPYFLLEATVFDASLENGAGERRNYDEVGPIHATVGHNYCGG